MVKWYKSKKEVYLARAIWFGTGLISIYGGITNPKPFSCVFFGLAPLCFLCSLIVGRWSYKE